MCLVNCSILLTTGEKVACLHFNTASFTGPTTSDWYRIITFSHLRFYSTTTGVVTGRVWRPKRPLTISAQYRSTSGFWRKCEESFWSTPPPHHHPDSHTHTHTHLLATRTHAWDCTSVYSYYHILFQDSYFSATCIWHIGRLGRLKETCDRKFRSYSMQCCVCCYCSCIFKPAWTHL